MAEQVSSLFGELTLQDNYTVVLNNAVTATDTFVGKVERAGQKLTSFGASLGTLLQPAVSSFESAAGAAFDFNETMTNTQAVMGATQEEIKALSSEILEIGRNSRAGPQMVADAFYDIAGSVNDVNQRMPILNESIATAEAGNADLLATTKALTSTMNSYAGSTLTVSQASDIMTRTVGMGVGTMDDFASALPQITGLANSLKISFLDIGTAAAFLTTKGNTASQATTQLGAIMNAFMGPNETMRKALDELGFASGNAAIEQLGLVGAIDAIRGTSVAGEEGLLRLLGTQEALRGVTSLAGADFKQFAADFAAGVDGATGAAREIQNMSEAASLDFLKSEFEALKIEVGMGLAPALVEVVKEARPLVKTFTDFVKKNPKVVAAVGLVTAALASVAAVATTTGLVVSGLGLAFGGVAAVLGSPLLIPILGVIAILGGLYAAWKTNFGGIRDFVMPIVSQIKTGFEGLQTFISYFAESFRRNGLVGMFREMFNATVDGQTSLEWLFNAFGLGSEKSKKLADSINAFGNAALNTLVNDVMPALRSFGEWFTTTALPAATTFLQNVAWPAFKTFMKGTGQLAFNALLGLSDFGKWFLTDGLPKIRDFIQNDAKPKVKDFFDMLGNAWSTIKPKLDEMYTWFVYTSLPFIGEKISAAQEIFNGWKDDLVKFWNEAKPGLQDAWTWITQTLVPELEDALQNKVIKTFNELKNIMSTLWAEVSPHLNDLWKGVKGIFDLIKSSTIDPAISAWNTLISVINSAKSLANAGGIMPSGKGKTPVQNFASGFVNAATAPFTAPISLVSKLLGRAEGGPVMAGRGYVVGEREPELFVPNRSGHIYNQDQLGGRGIQIYDGLHIHANSEAEGAAAARGLVSEAQRLGIQLVGA